MEPLNARDYERLAEERLDPGAFGYFAGGAEDEWTLAENVAAFRRWVLRPRVLADVTSVTTETTVLGTRIALPLLVAPFAFQRLAHPDGELATARAAAAGGTIMCLSTIATAGPAEVAAAAPDAPRWFQLYVFRDRGVTRALLEQAVEARYSAVVLTVDAPYLGRRERDLRTGFRLPAGIEIPSMAAAGVPAGTPAETFSLIAPDLSWRDVEQLAGETRLPLVVKGIQTGEDAALACDYGAAAVVVSNHGGRQLDGVAASIDVLPEAVEAAAGRVEVLMDGGVRRGADAVKALALGARACLVGRPVVWALAVGGEAGVARLLDLLREEVRVALGLLGCHSPADVGPAHVAPAAAYLRQR